MPLKFKSMEISVMCEFITIKFNNYLLCIQQHAVKYRLSLPCYNFNLIDHPNSTL